MANYTHHTQPPKAGLNTARISGKRFGWEKEVARRTPDGTCREDRSSAQTATLVSHSKKERRASKGIFVCLGRQADSFSAPLLQRADCIVGNCTEVAMIGSLYYHELEVNSHENRTRER